MRWLFSCSSWSSSCGPKAWWGDGNDPAPVFFNRWLLFAVVVGAIALFMDHDYYYTLLNFIGIYTMLVVGLNLLLGYAGQIFLGHAAFFGLGAYTSGILTATCGVDPWLALVAGLGVSGTAAFLIGIPALKLRGYYLAMATLGFGIIIYIILNQAQGSPGDLRASAASRRSPWRALSSTPPGVFIS